MSAETFKTQKFGHPENSNKWALKQLATIKVEMQIVKKYHDFQHVLKIELLARWGGVKKSPDRPPYIC